METCFDGQTCSAGQQAEPCPRVKMAGSFGELVRTPLAGGVNALCWPRNLPGDFGEVVAKLSGGGRTGTLNAAILADLDLSAAGHVAVKVLMEDLRRLEELGLEPLLDCIKSYPVEDKPGAVRTDVYSFHADSATGEADTWLCTYYGPASEGLCNDEAQRRVDHPETRAALLKEYAGADDGGFAQYLTDHCYDLHYQPLPEARPFSFGQGNLWRIAVEYPGSPVPPCIHRAPENLPGMPPRLLLIS